MDRTPDMTERFPFGIKYHELEQQNKSIDYTIKDDTTDYCYYFMLPTCEKCPIKDKCKKS